MSQRPSNIWAYVLIAFSLVILGLSMFALLQAMNAYQAGQTWQFVFYGLWSLVGTVLAVSSITRINAGSPGSTAGIIIALRTLVERSVGPGVIKK